MDMAPWTPKPPMTRFIVIGAAGAGAGVVVVVVAGVVVVVVVVVVCNVALVCYNLVIPYRPLP